MRFVEDEAFLNKLVEFVDEALLADEQIDASLGCFGVDAIPFGIVLEEQAVELPHFPKIMLLAEGIALVFLGDEFYPDDLDAVPKFMLVKVKFGFLLPRL